MEYVQGIIHRSNIPRPSNQHLYNVLMWYRIWIQYNLPLEYLNTLKFSINMITWSFISLSLIPTRNPRSTYMYCIYSTLYSYRLFPDIKKNENHWIHLSLNWFWMNYNILKLKHTNGMSLFRIETHKCLNKVIYLI